MTNDSRRLGIFGSGLDPPRATTAIRKNIGESSMRRLLIGLLLFPTFSFADHEPPEYSFAAKRGNLPSSNYISFSASASPKVFPAHLDSDPYIKARLDDLLTGEPRVALSAIAISKGNIVYEKYLRDGADNLYPSWSMAKSLTSLTAGYALCDSKIKSLDDKAEQYADVLRGTAWGDAKIKDLLMMTSGAPIDSLNKLEGDYIYQSRGLIHAVSRNIYSLKQAFKFVSSGTQRAAPGERFAYSNLDTEAVAAVVAGATNQPFQEYFQKRIWNSINPEHQAVWLLDKDKQAIASAYFFASMRDYAKIAQHIVDIYKGRAGNDCLRNYLKEATTPRKNDGGRIWYGYQFWIYGAKGDTFAMWGHQGQEILINPEKEKILVLTAYHSSIRNKYRDPKNLVPWLRTD